MSVPSIAVGGGLGEKLVEAAEGTLLIRGVRLIDGRGGAPLDNATIVIEGTRIAAVETGAIGTPDGATEIDGSGLIAIPGLIDAHVHLTGFRTSEAFRRYLGESRDVRLIRAVQDMLSAFEAGYTAMRDCGLGSLGVPLREILASRSIVGPHVAATYRSISHTGGHCDWHFLPHDFVKETELRGAMADGVEDCMKAVRRNIREGATFTKVMVTTGNLGNPRVWPPKDIVSVEEIRAIVEATHAYNYIVAAHCIGSVGVRKAVDCGADTIEHGVIADDWGVLDLMAERGTILVPTMSVFHWMAAEGAARGMQGFGVRAAAETSATQREMVKRAKAAGVRIAAGTDTGSSFAIGRNAMELQLLTEAGLTPMEALVAATQTAADALGWGSQIGTLEPGKLADIVLLNFDPLQDIPRLQDKASVVKIVKAQETLN